MTVDLAPVTIGGRQSARPESTVWLTPRRILQPLGEFALDPCAAPDPDRWPTARRHITLPDDGLTADWEGRVWLNPPYSTEGRDWLARLAAHGDGIALMFARMETSWFFDNVFNTDTAAGVLFLRGRVRFIRPDTLEPAADNGGAPSVLIAYGERNAEVLYANQLNLNGAFMAVGSRPPVLTIPGTLNTPSGRHTGVCDRCWAARRAGICLSCNPPA